MSIISSRQVGGLLQCVTAAVCLAALAPDARAEHGAPGNGGLTVDPAIASYTSDNGLSGRLSIAGSDTMRPLVAKLAAQFTAVHPGAQIAVEGTGSGSAVREFLLGISYQRRGDKVRGRGTTGGSNTVELLASSRQLNEDELKGFESNHGHRPLEVPIAMDAVAIYVHRDNPVQELAMEQVDAIFSKDRKRGHAPITTWKQVGVHTGLGEQPIHLYGRDKKSGTREFFKHVALKDGELKPELLEQPGSASEIIAIAQDPLAIGYAGVGFQISAVRTVPVAAVSGQPAVQPSAETVTSGAYPLGRSLYLYVKDQKDDLAPVVKEFLAFVNSRQGQETVARANFYPLPNTQVAKNRQELGLPQSPIAQGDVGETDVLLAGQAAGRPTVR
jgi:phosphate transport system substrate-binding protein